MVEDTIATPDDLPPACQYQNGMKLRRMVFTTNQNLVQSEALLVPTPRQQPSVNGHGPPHTGRRGQGKASAKKAAKVAKQAAAKAVTNLVWQVDHGQLMCGYHRSMVEQISLMLGAQKSGRCRCMRSPNRKAPLCL